MATDWSKYVIPVGAIALGYYVLQSWGIVGPACDPTCTQCLKGNTYSQWFGQCDNNYSPCGWFHENCCCNCCVSLLESDNSLEEMGWTPLSIDELMNLRDFIDSL